MTPARDYAIRIVTGTTLAAKLEPPPELMLEDLGAALRIAAPGRPAELPIVSGRATRVPPLAGMRDPSQRARILHALANHELQAIELFAWALLAYPDAPIAFRRGLVAILADEQRHFALYAARLGAHGTTFGDHPVTGHFWNKLEHLSGPLEFVCAMCLTFEHANLDFAGDYAEAARRWGDVATAEALDQVHADEIRHVHFGWVWLRRLAGDVDPWRAYNDHVTFPLGPARARGARLDRDARRRAGIDEAFIDALDAESRRRARVASRDDRGRSIEAVSAAKQGCGSPWPEGILRMTFVIHANLDQEATWAAKPLSQPVRLRIARLAALVGVLAPEGEAVEVYAPAAVPPLEPVGTWTPPVMRGGTPPSADLVWADPGAKTMNDRRFGLKAARAAGWALPGTRVIGSIGDLQAHLAAGGADASGGAWVCKAPWTTAGRDRCYGKGTLTDDHRAQVKKLLAHHHALMFEPWMQRIADFAVCARVDATGAVIPLPPHRLLSGPRGGFRGISLDASELGAAEYDLLMIAAEYAGGALHRAGYVGPFGVDAFAYDDGGTRRFHPFCEVNVRHTFGHVAHALGARLGITTLGFDPPPPGATVLVTTAYLNHPLAWVS